MSHTHAVLKAVATCLPSTQLTNDEMARSFTAWSGERIRRATGIRVRGIASETECASDLGVEAARRLFATGVCQPEDVDFLLFCSQTPDYLIPSTSCIMQRRLGLSTRCGAFDINQGCSGFVYALATAKGLIESGSARCVLIINGDTYSKILRPEDAPTRILFGDGAAASLVTATGDDDGWIGPFVFGSDGCGATDIALPNSGMRDHGSRLPDAERYLVMDGLKVFNFMTASIPPLVQHLLDQCEMTLDDVDHFVFHQASKVILEHLRDRIGIPEERFTMHLEESGNTGSATIPSTLRHVVERGIVSQGDTVMLVAYGAGFSWAGAMIRNALVA